MIPKITTCIFCTLGLGVLTALFCNLLVAPAHYFWSDTWKLVQAVTLFGWAIGILIGTWVSLTFLERN